MSSEEGVEIRRRRGEHEVDHGSVVGRLAGSGIRGLRKLLAGLRHRITAFYGAVGLLLTVGFGAALLVLFLLAQLADEVLEGETLAIDEAILLWLDSRATPSLDVAALEITALGNTLTVGVMVAVAAAILWTLGRRASTALLILSVAGAAAINPVLKSVFNRPRPEVFEWRAHYAGLSSFPSGHAVASMVLFTVLAYIIYRLEPARWISVLAGVIAAVLILLVGVSRLYLGVHYPSDVAAGFAVGFSWAIFCAMMVEVVWPRWDGARNPSGAESPAVDP